MHITQYNEIERAQMIKATNKLTHRASVKLVETNEDETTPLTTPPSAKPNKLAKENASIRYMPAERD